MTQELSTKLTTQLPILPKNEPAKASVQIEQQRATAQTLGSFQMAIQYPRDEAQCYERIMELCTNVYFASDALYSVPRGGQKAEGLTIKAAKEIARNWGNLDYGFIEHGQYKDETQMEAFCYDLERNVRSTVRFTVSHFRKSGENIVRVVNPQEVDELCKARASKEVRNAIFGIIPNYIAEEAIKVCKRTMHKEVKDIQESWQGFVKLYEKLGVMPHSLLRYLNTNSPDKLKADDIVDLRVLYGGLRDGTANIDETFPERKKEAKKAEDKNEEVKSHNGADSRSVTPSLQAGNDSESTKVATELPGKPTRARGAKTTPPSNPAPAAVPSVDTKESDAPVSQSLPDTTPESIAVTVPSESSTPAAPSLIAQPADTITQTNEDLW